MPAAVSVPGGQFPVATSPEPAQHTADHPPAGLRRAGMLFLAAIAFAIALLSLAPSALAAYPSQQGTLVVAGNLTPGGTVTTSGGGFAPGATVSVLVFSSPQLLATTSASPAGTATATITLPTNLPAGTHTLQMVGAAPGGGTTKDNVTFTVAGGAPASSSSGGLAFTGASIAIAGALAVLALAVGGAFVLIARRD